MRTDSHTHGLQDRSRGRNLPVTCLSSAPICKYSSAGERGGRSHAPQTRSLLVLMTARFLRNNLNHGLKKKKVKKPRNVLGPDYRVWHGLSDSFRQNVLSAVNPHMGPSLAKCEPAPSCGLEPCRLPSDLPTASKEPAFLLPRKQTPIL